MSTKLGLLLDNLNQPANSSYRKLKAMGATAVGTLWTPGTKHHRNVYEQCELMLGRPFYMIRVGGHRQTPTEWTTDARDALAEMPNRAIDTDRVLLICGNEPNLEGYADDPAGYIALYRAIATGSSVPIAAAAPSFGLPGGPDYFNTMCSEYGRPFPRLVANLYAHLVAGLLPAMRRRCDKLYIGEVNTLDLARRVEFLRGAFRAFAESGVEAALIFIAGGQSNGAWDENYIVSEEQAAALGALPKEESLSIAVALCPSNQDRNVSKIRRDYNEYGGMHWQAPLIAEKCRGLGINVQVIAATPESADKTSLAGLIDQQKRANDWLDGQPDAKKVIVNFHTDSGDASHTFAIWGTQDARSRALAEAIGMRVHDVLGTGSYQSFSKLGDKDYSTYVFARMARYPAALIEECSHENARDMDALYSLPQAIAEAFARGIAAYAGLSTGIDWQAEAKRLTAVIDSAKAALAKA